MANRRLCVVHGVGSDAVGLVKSLSQQIAQARGNIVDCRQDVINGLFTFVAVVDLSLSDLRLEAFQEAFARVAEETGLRISVDSYVPRPRLFGRRNILLIVVGRDAPGIVAETATLLSRYRINIEFSRTVARQGVFLMELLCDMSHCAIPQDLLMADLREAMAARELQAMFQTENVFNKRKRVVLFDIASSFLEAAVRDEILRHSGVVLEELLAGCAPRDPVAQMRVAAARLDGLGTDVLDSISKTIQPTDATMELVQTLKVLGYRIALVSRGFSQFMDALGAAAGLDYVYGLTLGVDEDNRTVVGQAASDAVAALGRHRITTELVAREGVAEADVTVISDDGLDEPIGLRFDFDLATILSHHKRHILSRDALMGLLGSFGCVGARLTTGSLP